MQVQINTEAPGFSPLEAEQRITFAIETAMAGLPRLDYTRSISRYGLSQVTVVFEDGTDIYFARQRVGERLQEVRAELPPGLEPELGPIATGLGEIFSFILSVAPGARRADGTPYDTTDLHTVMDWVVRPQLARVPGVTEVNMIGGHERQYVVAPRPTALLAFGSRSPTSPTRSSATTSNVGAGYIERFGSQYLVRVPGQVASLDDIARDPHRDARRHADRRSATSPTSAIGKDLRTGAATMNGEEVVLGTVFMLMGENSRIVARAAAAKLDGDQRVAARRPAARGRLRPHDARRQDHRHRAHEPARGRAARRRRAVRAARQPARGARHDARHSVVDAADDHGHGRERASAAI